MLSLSFIVVTPEKVPGPPASCRRAAGRLLRVQLKQFKRAAKRANDRIRDDVPLFADLLPTRTVTDEYWRWRFNKAEAAENVGAVVIHAKPLLIFRLGKLLDLARRHLPAGDVEKLHGKILETYPCVDYWTQVWGEVLAGKKRIACRLEVQTIQGPPTKFNSSGERRHVVEKDILPAEGWRAPFEHRELLAMLDAGELHCPSDRELFQKLERAFSDGTKRENDPH